MPAGHSSRHDTERPGVDPLLLSDRYRLDSVLGQGGVGTVWKARDLQLGRDVAVKRLQEGVARDPVVADRFRREATTAASLSHPSLVTIYDVGEDDGIVYLVMELVEGPSVKDVLAAGGPLAPGEVAALGHRVAQALAAVHERGLVHRDVKPGNVLLPVDGPPKLVDFGTVHVLGDAASTLTTPGTMLGTIGYVAPEQFEGHGVDTRADVFALGLVMHECLTGEPTFGTGTIAELTRRRLADDAQPPSRKRPDLPPRLDEVVVRATRRDPGERYPDAEALAAALLPLVPGDGDGRLRALGAQFWTPPTEPDAPTPARAHELPDPPEAPEDVQYTQVLPRESDDDQWEDAGQTMVVPPGPTVAPGPPPRDVDATTALHDTADTGSIPAAPPPPTRPTPPPPPVSSDEPPPAADEQAGWRRLLVPLAAMLGVVVLVLALTMNGGQQPAGDGGGGGSQDDDGGGGGATAVQVAGGSDLDPFGGGSEHGDDVPLAFDGDPGTRWDTEGYNSPTLDKPGVGMWVRAADGGNPRRVEVDMAIPGADIEVYALDAEPAGDPAAWGDPVGTTTGAEGTVGFDLPEGTNVVLVWFTKVGPDGGRNRGGISEIRLFG